MLFINKLTLTFLSVLLFSFIFIQSVSAASCSLLSASISVSAKVPAVVEKSIVVKNKDTKTITVYLEASDEIKDLIEFENNPFTIKRGKTGSGKFTVTLTEPGEHTGYIRVTCSEEGGGMVGVVYNAVIKIYAKEGESMECEGTNTSCGVYPNCVDCT